VHSRLGTIFEKSIKYEYNITGIYDVMYLLTGAVAATGAANRETTADDDTWI